ncbi:phosphopyruvate hydratase [Patescibacteria group bacterium]|nr:phosphopyruvate hydratase [Patescibacteria group bacterium]MBU1889880.1 phosphopyruvate hydratase [Patescibacteria group bacterium]
MSTKIENMFAREILDSRGNPTVEVRVRLENGMRGRASVPSGASKGTKEALELRDGDKKRFHGLGVLKACDNINTILNKELKGLDAVNQSAVDKRMIELDGTERKEKIGANAILAVSMGVLRAATKSLKLPLYKYLRQLSSLSSSKDYAMPTPIMNIFNGGKHADTNLDFQEFWIVPHSAPTVKEKIRMGAEVFHRLKDILQAEGLDTDIGNEGGYAPDINSSIDAMEWIMKAIKECKYKPGKDLFMGIDAGATTFYDSERDTYFIEVEDSAFDTDKLIDLYERWSNEYPIRLIEDGLREDDNPGWQKMTKKLSDKMTVIGDDIFCTNLNLLKDAIKKKIGTGILIKPNQVGTISETIETVEYAKKNNYEVIVSHRSGETTDTTIADFAVGLKADYLKAGSVSRGERVVKYNRLMEIEDEVNK